MPSVAELYNQEVLDGHREALAVLRELLAQERDPLERRKLANAILRARRVKSADPETPPAPRPRTKASRNDLDVDYDDDEWDRDEREAQQVVDRITASPDPGAALRELHALMTGCMNTLGLNGPAPESS